MTQNRNVNIIKIWGLIQKYGVLVLAFFLVVSLFQNILFLRRSTERLKIARETLQKEERDYNDLNKRLAEVRSPLNQEKMARDSLGLAREGDTVFVLPDEEVLKELAPKMQPKQYKLPDANWKLWLDLFI